MQAGDIWMVCLPFVGGREQSGERPGIVIQDAAYGAGSPLVLVVPLTSQTAAMRFPGAVRIPATPENGLRTESVAMVFQLRSLDRKRFRRRTGAASPTILSGVLSELDRLTGR